MKTTLSTLAALSLTVAATSANAALLITEDFESGAVGWNLNATPGTSSTTIASVDLGLGDGPSNVLRIATGSTYQIAETPTMDLSGATKVTLRFDYGDTNGGSTRFMSVDFWNGSTWTQIGSNITHNAANQANVVVDVTTGLGTNNKFRFEGKNAGGGGTHYSYIDNVDIFTDDDDTVIPEPGSLALLGLGTLMMIKRRRD